MRPELEQLISQQSFLRKPAVKVLSRHIERNLLPDDEILHSLITLKGLAVATQDRLIYTDSAYLEAIPYTSIKSFKVTTNKYTFVGTGNSVTIDQGRGKAGTLNTKAAQDFIQHIRQLANV